MDCYNRSEYMQDRMTCKIDENLKNQFRTFCEEKDVSCSEMLRRMILILVGKESKYII